MGAVVASLDYTNDSIKLSLPDSSTSISSEIQLQLIKYIIISANSPAIRTGRGLRLLSHEQIHYLMTEHRNQKIKRMAALSLKSGNSNSLQSELAKSAIPKRVEIIQVDNKSSLESKNRMMNLTYNEETSFIQHGDGSMTDTEKSDIFSKSVNDRHSKSSIDCSSKNVIADNARTSGNKSNEDCRSGKCNEDGHNTKTNHENISSKKHIEIVSIDSDMDANAQQENINAGLRIKFEGTSTKNEQRKDIDSQALSNFSRHDGNDNSGPNNLHDTNESSLNNVKMFDQPPRVSHDIRHRRNTPASSKIHKNLCIYTMM